MIIYYSICVLYHINIIYIYYIINLYQSIYCIISCFAILYCVICCYIIFILSSYIHNCTYGKLNIAMENHHFYRTIPLFLWPCSIAMLVYQRVCHIQSCYVIVYPIVSNGFADHYSVFKWLFHWEYTLFSDKPTYHIKSVKCIKSMYCVISYLFYHLIFITVHIITILTTCILHMVIGNPLEDQLSKVPRFSHPLPGLVN